mmetsp:Transcript_7009/g.22764  ORF Transcript_7009/g.22764 Transcript_7009/m.22764 type:complete len:372 (-) Transcript_7009:127-1242(-)
MSSMPPQRTMRSAFGGRRSAICANVAMPCSRTTASSAPRRSTAQSSSRMPWVHMSSLASSFEARLRSRPTTCASSAARGARSTASQISSTRRLRSSFTASSDFDRWRIASRTRPSASASAAAPPPQAPRNARADSRSPSQAPHSTSARETSKVHDVDDRASSAAVTEHMARAHAAATTASVAWARCARTSNSPPFCLVKADLFSSALKQTALTRSRPATSSSSAPASFSAARSRPAIVLTTFADRAASRFSASPAMHARSATAARAATPTLATRSPSTHARISVASAPRPPPTSTLARSALDRFVGSHVHMAAMLASASWMSSVETPPALAAVTTPMHRSSSARSSCRSADPDVSIEVRSTPCDLNCSTAS